MSSQKTIEQNIFSFQLLWALKAWYIRKGVRSTQPAAVSLPLIQREDAQQEGGCDAWVTLSAGRHSSAHIAGLVRLGQAGGSSQHFSAHHLEGES